MGSAMTNVSPSQLAISESEFAPLTTASPITAVRAMATDAATTQTVLVFEVVACGFAPRAEEISLARTTGVWAPNWPSIGAGK